jgi:hypothetical protein
MLFLGNLSRLLPSKVFASEEADLALLRMHSLQLTEVLCSEES